MPDDEKVTELNEKETTEAEDAFSEDVKEEDKKDEPPKKDTKAEKEPDKKDKKATEKEKEPEKREEVKDEKKAKEEEKEPEEETELTAKEQIDKRLESLDEEEEPELEPEKKEEKTESTVLTKEDIVDRLNLFSEDDLPGKMVIGNLEIDLKEYAIQYPEEFGIIKVASSAIAEKMIEKALEGIKGAEQPGDIDTKLSQLDSRITKAEQATFDNTVAQATDDKGNLKHPDYFTITRGDGMKDFHKWVKSQPENIQRLASSLNPDDGILILDYYKEATAKKKVADFDKKAADKKKEIDDIHGSTTRSDKSIKDSGEDAPTKSQMDEAEAAFMEE
jgi:hypothetical protein